MLHEFEIGNSSLASRCVTHVCTKFCTCDTIKYYLRDSQSRVGVISGNKLEFYDDYNYYSPNAYLAAYLKPVHQTSARYPIITFTKLHFAFLQQHSLLSSHLRLQAFPAGCYRHGLKSIQFMCSRSYTIVMSHSEAF